MGSVLNAWRGRLAPAAGAALLATTACGPDEVVIPQPPAPLAQLVAVYDQPTGTVPVDDVSMAMADAQRRIEALELGRLPDLVVEFTRRLRTRLQDADLATDPEEAPDDDVPDIDGYVNVNRVCRGWDRLATTPDPATNGQVQGTATVRDGHLEEELWGTASSCRDRVPADSALQVNVFVDGKLGILLEAEVPDSLASAQLLVAFEGTVGSERAATAAVVRLPDQLPQDRGAGAGGRRRHHRRGGRRRSAGPARQQRQLHLQRAERRLRRAGVTAPAGGGLNTA